MASMPWPDPSPVFSPVCVTPIQSHVNARVLRVIGLAVRVLAFVRR